MPSMDMQHGPSIRVSPQSTLPSTIIFTIHSTLFIPHTILVVVWFMSIIAVARAGKWYLSSHQYTYNLSIHCYTYLCIVHICLWRQMYLTHAYFARTLIIGLRVHNWYHLLPSLIVFASVLYIIHTHPQSEYIIYKWIHCNLKRPLRSLCFFESNQSLEIKIPYCSNSSSCLHCIFKRCNDKVWYNFIFEAIVTI